MNAPPGKLRRVGKPAAYDAFLVTCRALPFAAHGLSVAQVCPFPEDAAGFYGLCFCNFDRKDARSRLTSSCGHGILSASG